MQSAGILHDGLEAFSQSGEVIAGHDGCSVGLDQRQTHAEEDLGALVEEAVPYPQHRLDGQDFGEQTDEPFGRYHCPGEACKRERVPFCNVQF